VLLKTFKLFNALLLCQNSDHPEEGGSFTSPPILLNGEYHIDVITSSYTLSTHRKPWPFCAIFLFFHHNSCTHIIISRPPVYHGGFDHIHSMHSVPQRMSPAT